jgi:hypothetical protein
MHWLSPLEIRLAYRRARRKQFAAGVGPGHLPATLTAAAETSSAAGYARGGVAPRSTPDEACSRVIS